MKQNPLKRFFGHQSGSVLILVGLSFLFLVGIAGAGYDLGRQQLVRQKIQQSSDAAALAAASIECRAEPCTIRHNVAQRYYDLNFPATYLGVTRPPPTITVPAGGSITVSARADVTPSFVRNLGVSELTSRGRTVVANGGGGAANFDVLLLLDDSGSMMRAPDGTYPTWNNPSKLQALNTAAITLIDLLLNPNADHPCITDLQNCNRIGVIQYTVGAPPLGMRQSNSGALSCNCMRSYVYYCCTPGCGGSGGNGGESNATDIFGKKFFAGLGNGLVSNANAQSSCPGCAGFWQSESALPTCNTFVANQKPICTTFNPQSAACNAPAGCVPTRPSPDSDGTIWGCFPDELETGGISNMNYCEKKVIAAGGDCDWHPNYESKYPLDYHWNKYNVYGGLPNQWYASGKTNSAEAFRVASDPAGVPASATNTGSPIVFLPAARTQQQGVAKVVIWLTDGDNTAWTDTTKTTTDCSYSYNYQSCSGRVNFGNSTNDDRNYGMKSDTATRAACDALKHPSDGSPPTIIYTIGFGVEAAQVGSRAYNVLKYCASSDSHFMVAPDAATLQDRFEEIYENLLKLRITE